MANSGDFLTWVFIVKFKPKCLLDKFLHESIKFNHDALLTLTAKNKFQIKAEIPGHPGVLSLEVKSDQMFSNFDTDRYSLRFSAQDWYQRIKDTAFVNPFCSMAIKKMAGSTDVYCLIGEEDRLIKLGKADFVQRAPTRVADPEFYVRMSMTAATFRQVMHAFLIGHNDEHLPFRIGLTAHTLMLIAPDTTICYYVLHKGIAFSHGNKLDRMTLRLQWDRDLFTMLISATTGCKTVEITFSRNLVNQLRYYQIRFISNGLSYQEEGEEEVVH